jgi:hypothetical protein
VLGVHFNGGQAGEPTVRYAEAPKPYKEPTAAEACADRRMELLGEEGEPTRPKEVVVTAREARFKEGVVYRAAPDPCVGLRPQPIRHKLAPCGR